MNAVLMVIIVMSLTTSPDTGKTLVRHKQRVFMAPSMEYCQDIKKELADPANGPAALVLCIQPSDIDREPVDAPPSPDRKSKEL